MLRRTVRVVVERERVVGKVLVYMVWFLFMGVG
jgi:hypothetical protein